MDPNNHVNTLNHPSVENEHVVFDWFYNGDSSITSKSSGSPLISSVESSSFDESLNNFINGVNNYDPYFHSTMGLIPTPYNHDEVEAYANHHNHISTSTNAGLTSSSSSTSVVDFNVLHSFEELFPLLDEDLVTHDPLNILHSDQAISNNVNYLISDQTNANQIDKDDDQQSIVIIDDDNNGSSHEDQIKKKQANKKPKKKYCNGKAVLIDFDEISKHFDVPITFAAKRLNVGLTALKKRCRELNIERWPHRKIQSLKSLIDNLKDEVGYCKELEMLEEHKRMMEILPDMELTEQTKKIRQACFKVNYKKRRSSSLASSSSSSSSSSSMVPSSIYSS